MPPPKIPNLILLLLTFIPMIFVSGLAIRTGDQIEGYKISGPMGFKGMIHGIEVEMEGTVEEIYANFTSMYPEVVAKAKAAANAEANSHNTTNLNLSQFDTRNPSPRGDHYCCPIQGQWNWLPALIQTLRQGIDYLNNFNGVCNTGGGPGNCVRVSCSYSAAIYLCNDNESDLVISCKDVAFYADQIIDFCHVKWGDGWHSCGQMFDNGNYNVINRMDSC